MFINLASLMKVFARATRQKLCRQYSSPSFRAASTKTEVLSHESDETREEFQVPIRRYKSVPVPIRQYKSVPIRECKSDSILDSTPGSKRIDDTVSKFEKTRVDQKGNRAIDLPNLLTDFSHEQLIAELRDALQQDSTSIQDIRELLSAARTRIEKLPFAERRDAASRGHPGGHCLRWLWKNRMETLNEDVDRQIAEDLCWFLHAEGHMDYLDRWIDIAAKEVTDAKVADGDYRLDARMTWGSRIFSGQINAELAWSTDGSANTALTFFKARFESLGLHLGRENRAFSYVHAIVCLKRKLVREDCPPSDHRLFNWFADCSRISHGSHNLAHASLNLYRPSQPDASAFSLEASKYYLEPENRTFTITKPEALDDLGVRMLRAAYILQLQGKLEDARALEDLIIKHHPKVWQLRFTQYKRLRKDPKLEQLHQEAEGKAREAER